MGTKRTSMGVIVVAACLGLLTAAPLWGQMPAWQASIAKVSVDLKLERTPGTAFVVGVQGSTAFLVTCAHNVEGEASPRLEFLAAPYRTITATVRGRESGDNPRGLALLVVENIPPEVRSLPLAAAANPVTGERVIVAGFPRPTGRFLAPETTIAGQDGLDLAISRETTPGFSGGPVLRDGTAIGMVYSRDTGSYGGALISDAVVPYLRGLKVPLGSSNTGTNPDLGAGPGQSEPLTAGIKRVNRKDGLTYVWIPPGKFLMGCSPSDTECDDDEKPAHEVEISRGFWIGETEVTQAAYEKVVGVNPSRFKGPERPVEMLVWQEAREYCAAAGMRLPTEAEWEHAARGGTAGARYGELDAVAWTNSNSNRQAHLVGKKLANAYGLVDMLGNVWEWVEDYLGNYSAEAAKDPRGPSSGQRRVVRGGSWDYIPQGARASYRNGYGVGYRQSDIGFRCAGVLP